jgi:hypothetical protein
MSDVYKTHVPESGGGLYLRLKDGETAKVRIASEPAIYESVSERDGKETKSTRYAWLVFNQEKRIPQVMQQSATFFKTVASLAQDDEWGDPTDYDIKITRHGANFNDTTYTVTPSANRDPLDTEARKAVKEINLIEKIEVSPFAHHVYWLSEFDEKQNRPLDEDTGDRNPKAVVSKSDKVEKLDEVVTNFDENEPVNLDDIPF